MNSEYQTPPPPPTHTHTHTHTQSRPSYLEIGSYTSDHFICLLNEPLTSSINLIRNDQECKIRFNIK